VLVWEVLGKRTSGDDWAVVGGVKAPDAEMALVLARETHFRHKEGVAYAVRRRGDDALHVGGYAPEAIGGLTDHSYRRQEAYAGVGGKHKRISREMEALGLRIDRPRPPVGRTRPPTRREPSAAAEGPPPSGAELTPEDLAAQGTAG
jgi:1,2-phenylacetyl-CoA epoxidase PaaB subunit